MATIANTKVSGDNENTKWVWEQINNDDSGDELAFPGGEAYIEVKGTFDSATVQMKHGLTTGDLVNLSDTEAPEGASFTAAGLILVDLPKGFLQPSISGGGGSQDIDITVLMKNRKT